MLVSEMCLQCPSTRPSQTVPSHHSFLPMTSRTHLLIKHLEAVHSHFNHPILTHTSLSLYARPSFSTIKLAPVIGPTWLSCLSSVTKDLLSNKHALNSLHKTFMLPKQDGTLWDLFGGHYNQFNIETPTHTAIRSMISMWCAFLFSLWLKLVVAWYFLVCVILTSRLHGKV